MQQPFKNLKLTDHKPSLPSPKATPPPERNKVVSPVRRPINKQTALLISPNNCWLSKPPPQLRPVLDPTEPERLKAELKIERNAHAETRDELGKLRAQFRALRGVVAAQKEEIDRLNQVVRSQFDTIKQLEDLKL